MWFWLIVSSQILVLGVKPTFRFYCIMRSFQLIKVIVFPDFVLSQADRGGHWPISACAGRLGWPPGGAYIRTQISLRETAPDTSGWNKGGKVVRWHIRCLVIDLKGFGEGTFLDQQKLLHWQKTAKTKTWCFLVFERNRYNGNVRTDHRNILGFW